MSVMKKSEKNAWTCALRSGKYAQGSEALLSEKGYCCLGVAQHAITGRQPKEYANYLRAGRFGLSRGLQKALGNANDGGSLMLAKTFKKLGYSTAPAVNEHTGRSSFRMIANWIDKNL